MKLSEVQIVSLSTVSHNFESADMQGYVAHLRFTFELGVCISTDLNKIIENARALKPCLQDVTIGYNLFY